MKTHRGFFGWSARDERGRAIRTAIVRSPKHRDKAPKRKKIAAKRKPRTKDMFF